MKKLFLVVVLAITAPLSAQSLTPQVIASSGTSFSSAGAKLDFTIGEVSTSTLTASGNTLTQGFHQPELHFASIQDYNSDFNIILYPNPTEQFVTVESTKTDKMKVNVYDVNGKVIMVSNTFSNKITLDVSSVASGNYIMVITTENGDPIHSYSIIKKSGY